MTLTFMLMSVALISGCKQIEMKNGRIPDAYVAQAKSLEGVYEGYAEVNDSSGISQNLRQMTLTLKLDGNRPVLTASGEWLNDGCNSKIGPLLNVQVSKMKLKRVAFAFDAGTCKSTEISDIMMVNVTQMPNGKFKLFAWVMTGGREIATEDPTKTEHVSTMSEGHFQQK